MAFAADMDINEEPVDPRKCFKCKYELIESLNVVYSSPNSMIIFWNRFQLFLYEDFNFDDATKIFLPEFSVYQIMIDSNYLVCLDNNGNIHVTSLKFKNSAQKRLKPNFQLREKNILACAQRDDHILSLKYEDNSYFLIWNVINAEFNLEKQIPIKYEGGDWPLLKAKHKQEKCSITLFKPTKNKEKLKELFDFEEVNEQYEIVIITFNKLDVFACIFSPDMDDEIELTKLYSCPSEICSIQVVEMAELNVVIALGSGTVIKLPLVKNPPAPKPLHLNSAVCKLNVFQDMLMYTDGSTMWKTEDTYTRIKFTQFYVRHVKDFVRFGDQLICTTYSHLIYLIPFEDEKSYVKTKTSDYCNAERLLNNSEYLFRVMEEVDLNDEVVRNVHKEGNFITAMALSNRPDLMDSILQNEMIVYENYEDAIKENSDILLTEDLKEYFKPESLYILVRITPIQMEHLVNEVLAQLFHSSKLHICLFSERKALKTNTVRILETLKKINILIPVDYQYVSNTAEIKASIKIVSHMPGAFDSKEPLWTTLYSKEVNLSSEHFIKTNLISSKNISLNEPEKPISDLIMELARDRHGDLFKFTQIPQTNVNSILSLFVKLPSNYAEIFNNRELYTERFDTRKSEYLLKYLTSEEFLKGKNNLTFEVGKAKVNVEVINDEFTPLMLRVASDYGKIALNMRNFFAELINDDFKSYRPGVEFVDTGLYSVAEILRKSINECEKSESTVLQTLTDKFQKNVIGALPI